MGEECRQRVWGEMDGFLGWGFWHLIAMSLNELGADQVRYVELLAARSSEIKNLVIPLLTPVFSSQWHGLIHCLSVPNARLGTSEEKKSNMIM